MTVFKTFIKVLSTYKLPIIMYTSFLIFFAGFNFQTSDNNMSFQDTKPDIAIVCEDEEVGITKHLIDYLDENATIKDISNEDNKIEDALFYREISYVIYIPENYRNDILSGSIPEIEIKSTNDYEAALAEFQLERYMKAITLYAQDELISFNEEELILMLDDTLDQTVEVELTSKVDGNSLSNVAFYYNFMNYSLLAGCVYVICLILSSFKNKKIKNRTVISSVNYTTYNRKLLISSGVFAILLWGLYVLLSFILIKDNMFSMHGLWYIINSFVFMLCALSIAFLIATLVSDKNAINGIVNVVALGSSFLCGAFVPMAWLPDSVLTVAHILPSYYYIYNNELLTKVESFTFDSLQLILINMGIMILFIIVINVITNVLSKKKRSA